VTEDWLRQLVAKYEVEDDIFQKEFLRGVIFTGTGKVEITPEADMFLKSMNTS
jgi:hypothetical protein